MTELLCFFLLKFYELLMYRENMYCLLLFSLSSLFRFKSR